MEHLRQGLEWAILTTAAFSQRKPFEDMIHDFYVEEEMQMRAEMSPYLVGPLSAPCASYTT